ncbi:unnamed protein product [Heterobilharzia americana]|nr:unnamed protein product [Heterobilharzia americana]
MKMTDLQMQHSVNHQDELEFEDSLERMSRDLVSDILNRARCKVASETSNTEQNRPESQSKKLAVLTPQLSLSTSSSSPKKYMNTLTHLSFLQQIKHLLLMRKFKPRMLTRKTLHLEI